MPRDLTLALQSFPVFSSLSPSTLAEISHFCTVRAIRTGETIFCQGEPSPYFFGVLAGEVTIQRVSSDKRFPTKIIGVISVGDFFGESAIFEESPRLAMASASQDGELVLIRGTEFRQWLKKSAEASQPLLMSIIQSATGRLHRTNHELAVVYGVGRLFGSGKPFLDQLTEAFDFLKASFEGLDDLVFYQRSAYWDEFEPLKSFPYQELPAVPVENALLQRVGDLESVFTFQPRNFQAALEAFKLDWATRKIAAIIPLFNWEKPKGSLQGILLLASSKYSGTFSSEKQLLLSSVSLPITEALSRHLRVQESEAQSRLENSRQSYRQ